MKKPFMFLLVLLIASSAVAGPQWFGHNVAPHLRKGGVVVRRPLAGHEGGGLVLRGPLAGREGGG